MLLVAGEWSGSAAGVLGVPASVAVSVWLSCDSRDVCDSPRLGPGDSCTGVLGSATAGCTHVASRGPSTDSEQVAGFLSCCSSLAPIDGRFSCIALDLPRDGALASVTEPVLDRMTSDWEWVWQLGACATQQQHDY